MILMVVRRDAKSSSPRPVIAAVSSEPSTGFLTTANVRQTSLPFPTSHSLDDSQLRVGYNSTSLSSSGPSLSLRAVPLRRKISANIPYVFSESDLDVNEEFILHQELERNNPRPMVGDVSHQRTSSSPCRLMFTTTEGGGFTSEDEPELLELTSLSSLRRSTAKLLEAEPCLVAELNQQQQPFIRVGSAKRLRVSSFTFTTFFFFYIHFIFIILYLCCKLFQLFQCDFDQRLGFF